MNNKRSIFLDFSLLISHRNFRNIFIARTISILGLGMLSVAIPVQVYALTNDSFHVGLVMALEGVGLFIGLLLGGVLSDIYERRGIILLARSTCALGFLGMAINAWLPEPYLWVIYILSVWDGFFGALGVTALMACMPAIVGRENLMQARSISMASVRLATVISPAIGGIIITFSGVAWNYMIAVIGTVITVFTLTSLPKMYPKKGLNKHPLKSLWDGVTYIFTNKVITSVMLIGTLVMIASAVRVLFPALVENIYGGGAWTVGLMYSAIPLGATLGAIISGWASHLTRPGLVMMLTSIGAFLCLVFIGIVTYFPFAFALLVIFGYLVSITSLLQYSFVQGHTPDHYLGRVNGIWAAQNTSGDSIGLFTIGVLGKFFSSLNSIFIIGSITLGTGFIMLISLKKIRSIAINNPDIEES